MTPVRRVYMPLRACITAWQQFRKTLAWSACYIDNYDLAHRWRHSFKRPRAVAGQTRTAPRKKPLRRNPPSRTSPCRTAHPRRIVGSAARHRRPRTRARRRRRGRRIPCQHGSFLRLLEQRGLNRQESFMGLPCLHADELSAGCVVERRGRRAVAEQEAAGAVGRALGVGGGE